MMCAPNSDNTKHVVIVGAGPAGLLASVFLLRRNLNASSASDTKYRVILVDPGEDYGRLDSEGLNRARSWMIGLSCHGLSAIREVPDLYEDYIRGLGINIEHVVFGLGPKVKFETKAKDVLPPDSAFTVDRNYICAALSRYINDKFPPELETSNFVSMYHTRALYVDGDNHSLVVRSVKQSTIGANSGCENSPLQYDILLGCDGIRSVVRNAFITNHRDFEFNMRGAFSIGKSVHVPLPPTVKEGTFMFLNQAMPNMVSFILPETGKKLNVALGASINRSMAEELKSNDPSVVAAYFKKHFHAFDIDADEAGKQWVGQGWNSISQVHCNFYHSNKLNALLLGDAAHATSPNIGQGMNTALADAAALNKMLDQHEDDWKAVMPLFSKERVKEGNALTDLSFYTFSLSGRHQLQFMIRQTVRRTLNYWFPCLVDPDPMTEVSKGMSLSEAYHRMNRYGIIPAARAVNDKIMRDHFEKKVGMVRDDNRCGWWGTLQTMVLCTGIPVMAAVYVAGRYR